MLFSACSPTSSGSLVTDAMSITDCPAKSCATGVAAPEETKVVLTSPISLAMPIGSSFAEASGDCYPSLYPQNFFNIQVVAPGGATLPNATVLPAGLTVRCNNGKFYVPVNLQGQAAGTYTLNAQLVVVDSAGAQIVPPFKTVSATLIYRPQ